MKCVKEYIKDAGLTASEYDELVRRLGREPNYLELRMVGVMWSEHCSYKSTRNLLKTFPNTGDAVAGGVGENAGVVNVGDGWGVAFKVESHNHPSAVAPYQGAATGVGGIIRDILAMGARPFASMDGLCFGDPELPRTRMLADGIVRGIGGYGNAVGVPTVGGLTIYDPCYDENPLVNAFSAGLVRLDSMSSSQTARPGLDVVLLGSHTGRDGIAGAAFASRELAEDTSSSRPQIQIGDPFEEKLLIEACLELQEQGLIVGMQDMGAAGILSSSSEVAYKSGVGMDIWCHKIPLREPMEPWEIFLSESQERMLLVVEPDMWNSVLAVAQHYGLECAVVGRTNDSPHYRVYSGGEMVCDLPVSFLGGDAPAAEWFAMEPLPVTRAPLLRLEDHEDEESVSESLAGMFATYHLGDHSWIHDQYDSRVQVNTVSGPGEPVAVVRIKGAHSDNCSPFMVAFSISMNPWLCSLDPYHGTAELTAAALRKLYVAGAVPLGITNCLNFPSPEVPTQYWELSECVRGMGDAARALECPVVSGNVSLYNETPQLRIMPSPLVAATGRTDGESYTRSGCAKPGDHIYMVGTPAPSLGGSLYGRLRFGLCGRPLPFDGAAERDFRVRAITCASRRLVSSARALGTGGLAATLAAEALASGCGFDIKLPLPVRRDLFFFGEGGPRAFYAVPQKNVVLFRSAWRGYPLCELGVATEEPVLSFPGEEPFYTEALNKNRKGKP